MGIKIKLTTLLKLVRVSQYHCLVIIVNINFVYCTGNNNLFVYIII